MITSLLTLHFASRLSKPLLDLTEAAKQIDKGNYDFELDYSKDDEIGILTHTFQTLAAHTRDSLRTLNRQVYIDALTSVKNKAAYADHIQNLQDLLDDKTKQLPEFAIAVFDCDNLKEINDTYGHDKGDIYLKTGCQLICKTFDHSPVFRIGGDEFAVIMQNSDYQNVE